MSRGERMRKAVSLGLIILLAGCMPATRDAGREIEKKLPPANPNRIEISNSFGSGLYGGETRNAKWVLEKSGPCRGTVTDGRNAGNIAATVTEYELPAETFEECRALLESTRFFDLKIPRPQFLFEASGWGISASLNGRTNTVGVYTQTPPERFAKMREFLDELPKRGKVISSSP